MASMKVNWNKTVGIKMWILSFLGIIGLIFGLNLFEFANVNGGD